MSTLENLFVQIFDRKNWIIDQLKLQKDLYDQYLASTLLIKGIRPPSWLLGAGFEAGGSADLKELKKEELISGLLFPPSRPNVPCIGGHNHRYSRPITTANYGQVSDALFTDTCASNKYFNVGNVSTQVPKCHLNDSELDLGCALEGVSEQDNVITSPQGERETMTSNIHFEPDQSLARIQRSRSRQKALELRTSGKANSKKRQRKENYTGAYIGRITRSKTCINESVELQNLSNHTKETGCKLAQSRSATRQLHLVDESLQPSNSMNGNDDLLYAPDTQELAQSFRSGQKDLECVSIVSNLQEKFNFSADEQLIEKDQTQTHEVLTNEANPKPAAGELEKLNDVSMDKSNKLDVCSSSTSETSKLSARPAMKGAPEPCKDLVSNAGTRDDKNSQQEPIESLEEVGRSDDRHEKCGLSVAMDLLERDQTMEVAIKEENHARCNSSMNEQLVEKGLIVEILNNEGKSKPDHHGNYEVDKLDDVSTDKSKFDICTSPTGETSLSARLAIKAAPEFNEDLIGNRDSHDNKSAQQEPIESLEKVSRSDDMHEKCGLSVEVELLERHQTVTFSIEENFQGAFLETHEEDRSTAHLCADLSTEKRSNSSPLSPREGMFEIYGDFTANACQESNKLSQRSMSSSDHLSAGQVSIRSPVASQLDINTHGVETNRKEGSFVEKCTGGINILPNTILPEDSKSDTDVCLGSQKSKSHDINDGSGLSQRGKPEISLGFQKSGSSAGSTTDSAKVIGSKMASAPNTSQIYNLSHESPYFLRSYNNHKVNVKFNGSCFEAPNLRNILNCASENSWPLYKRRKIDNQSSDLFTTCPRLKRVKPCEQIPPVLDIHHFPMSDTEVTYSNDKVHKPLSPKLQSQKGEQYAEGGDQDANKIVELEKTEVKSSLNSILGCFEDNDEVADHDELVLNLEGQFASEGHQKCSSLKSTENIRSTKQFCSMERTRQERKSNIGEPVSYCSVGSPHNGDLDPVGGDQNLPEFEGFSIGASTGSGLPCIAGDGISWDKLDLPSSTSERISFLEQLCRSTSMLTPLPSSKYKLHNTPDIYRSLPNVLERIDLRDSVLFSNDEIEQLKASYNFMDVEISHSPHCDRMSSSSVQCHSDARKPSCTPPVSKLCQRIISSTSGHSSEKQQSMNPELTCFRIDEDTSTSEEVGSKYEVFDPLQKEDSPGQKNNATSRGPLVDMTNEFKSYTSVSVIEKFHDRGSLDSINTELNINGAQLEAEKKLRNGYGKDRRSKNRGKENQNSSLGVNGLEKTTELLNNRFSRSKLSGKVSDRKGNPSSLDEGHRHNNIVSNVSSFIPLVHQKHQSAAVYTGKRDIKVKALEAAEAAKRLEEKRENDRKLKKEAAKLERARLEQEKLRQLELQQKKKEEERKKKEADMATRKRLREEEERKEKERKRKCIEEARRLQKEQDEKLRAEKEEREQQRRTAAEREIKRKQLQIEERNHQRREKGNEQSDCRQKMRTNTESSNIPAHGARKEHECHEGLATLKESHDEVSHNFCKANESEASITEASGEQSYELSPYKDSDDEEEEEEEDELPNNKYIPSWARGKHLASDLLFTQRKEPSEIFTPAKNCSIMEFFCHK